MQQHSSFFSRLPTEVRLEIYRSCDALTVTKLEACCQLMRDEIAPSAHSASSVWGQQYGKHLQGASLHQPYAAYLLSIPTTPKERSRMVAHRLWLSSNRSAAEKEQIALLGMQSALFWDDWPEDVIRGDYAAFMFHKV